MARYHLNEPGDPCQQILHIDDADPMRGAVEVVQEGEAPLRAARIARDRGADSRSRELRHVAEIPMSVYLRACQEGWANDPKAWKKWANDPDNRDFRVAPGRV